MKSEKNYASSSPANGKKYGEEGEKFQVKILSGLQLGFLLAEMPGKYVL